VRLQWRKVLFADLVRSARSCSLVRPILFIVGRGVCGLEGVRIEHRTTVKSCSETARMAPQLLRVRLLPDGTRNFDDDERQETLFVLEHFIAAEAALNNHRDHPSRIAVTSASHKAEPPKTTALAIPDPLSQRTAESSHRVPAVDWWHVDRYDVALPGSRRVQASRRTSSATNGVGSRYRSESRRNQYPSVVISVTSKPLLQDRWYRVRTSTRVPTGNASALGWSAVGGIAPLSLRCRPARPSAHGARRNSSRAADRKWAAQTLAANF